MEHRHRNFSRISSNKTNAIGLKMSPMIRNTFHEYKGTLLFISLMLVFRSSFADFNHVPTGSMKPTILVGDRISINKLAYDIHLPFSRISIAQLANPVRGDIVVFNSAVSQERLVKRVVGVPGDAVQMNNNEITINGQTLRYQNRGNTPFTSDLNENLLGITHQIRINKNGSNASNFSQVTVPEGMYLVLGDNRDNSADSRFIGFVPRDEIIGRSSNVVYSLDTQNYYLPRSERLFKALD